MGVNSTPATFTTSEVVTATKLNTEIRDPWIGIQAAWTTYAPTWSASTTAPVIGNGAIGGRYLQIGKTIRYHISVLMGSTTTYGTGNYTFTLPFVPLLANASEWMGNAAARDNSGPTSRAFTAELSNTVSGTIALRQADNFTLMSNVSPYTWAVSDRISIHGEFEIA